MTATAVSEDGREAALLRVFEAPVASNQARMRSLWQEQLSKTTGHYRCRYAPSLTEDSAASALPLLSVATLNELRRQLCEQLDAQAVRVHPLYHVKPSGVIAASDFSYKANLSNSLAASVCCSDASEECGTGAPLSAFELNHQPDAELMRSRYCVRHELGLCPHRQGRKEMEAAPLFLENNGRRFRLDFDCSRCEMTVKSCE